MAIDLKSATALRAVGALTGQNSSATQTYILISEFSSTFLVIAKTGLYDSEKGVVVKCTNQPLTSCMQKSRDDGVNNLVTYASDICGKRGYKRLSA